jgi:hypothetical protein
MFVVVVLVRRIRRIATERVIVLYLLRAQETPLGKMGTQMHRAQLAVVASDGGGDVFQRFLRDRLGRKQAVKTAFFLNEPFSQSYGLLAHGRVNGVRLRALVFREMQLVGKFQDMLGARVVMQFSGLRQSHTATREIALYLGR